MWRLRLREELVIFGLKACQADGSIYVKHRRNQDGSYSLILILSAHVDDLKGGGEEAEVKGLVAQLTKAFGEGKLEHGNFEHCGVKHEQDPNDFFDYDGHEPLRGPTEADCLVRTAKLEA